MGEWQNHLTGGTRNSASLNSPSLQPKPEPVCFRGQTVFFPLACSGLVPGAGAALVLVGVSGPTHAALSGKGNDYSTTPFLGSPSPCPFIWPL